MLGRGEESGRPRQGIARRDGCRASREQRAQERVVVGRDGGELCLQGSLGKAATISGLKQKDRPLRAVTLTQGDDSAQGRDRLVRSEVNLGTTN